MPIQTENGLMLTYEDYVKIPEDGRRHEIIDGRHIVNPAPRLRHQIIVYKIGLAVQSLLHSGRADVVTLPNRRSPLGDRHRTTGPDCHRQP